MLARAGDRAGMRCSRSTRAPAHPTHRRCATVCSICARRASRGCFRTAAHSNSRLPNRCSKSISRSRSSCWWTASPSAPDHAAAAGGHRRNLLPRGRARSMFESAAPGGETLRFNEKFACKTCGMEFVAARAAAVQLQQPLRRVPAMPGFRQHHRLRHGPGDSRTGRCRSMRARSSRGRSRNTRQWLTQLPASRRQSASTYPVCDLTPGRTGFRWYARAFGPPRFFNRAREEEIQAARAGDTEPLSRLRRMSGVPGRETAAGGSLHTGRRARTIADVVQYEHRRGARRFSTR